ncbi:sporulation protein Cse60 [Bacillus smithii]|uniref:sporulation protein Cse60 n=1 Tax=Bacillus smithii TaxID=1479 RepID=UPI002E238696|nr:sporulation protein Cse60 [Bacillus smithii]MED1456643.1 sporulation protein Cse60 [Bacillus smithii]
MLKTRVVKATTSSSLEGKINSVLENLDPDDFVDIKVAGAYDGDDESFIAVIIYKS